MAKRKKYEGAKYAEEIYFTSKNASTLPEYEKIIEQIEQSIPGYYSPTFQGATFNRSYIEKITIHYVVDQVDVNRYRVTLWYNSETGGLGVAAFIAWELAFVCAGMLVAGPVGLLVGIVAAGLLFPKSFLESDRPGIICSNIEKAIKEYERSHLLSL